MRNLISFFLLVICSFSINSQQLTKPLVIDETKSTESIVEILKIDSVWAGHPVDFCLHTHGTRQYIAYYNAKRSIVVGQRNLNENKFKLHVLAVTARSTHKGTTTVTEWDSHNYLTIGVDSDGFIHLSGNVHANPLTYFRTTIPNDISTLEQIYEMVGTEEQRTTYPHFMLTKEGRMLFHYRDGGSGNGNEIYNIYDSKTQKWSRLLDSPLTDGQGLRNAYQSQPTLHKDGWYHMFWVWRETPDCSTNHDLSHMKSQDLKNWYNAFGEKIKMPVTFNDKSLIVDPIPEKGGIINLAAKMILDKNNQPVFVYHKYDSVGNTQLYTAQLTANKWTYTKISNWEYRWYFDGSGSVNKDISIGNFIKRSDGKYEVGYWHIKYGNGTILLNDKFQAIGQVLKPNPFNKQLKTEGAFPGLEIQTKEDAQPIQSDTIRYVLKWETLNRNRGLPREKPWPKPSQLYLYKLKIQNNN